MNGWVLAQDVIDALYEVVADDRLSWLDDITIAAGFQRRCRCKAMAPAGECCPVCGDNADGEAEMAVTSFFDACRCTLEAVFDVAPLYNSDPPLRISIAAAGGGTVGDAYAGNSWIYDVHLDGILVCSGSDLRSGAIPASHRDMAANLAVWLADSDQTPQALHACRDRLSCWASGITTDRRADDE